MKHYIVAPLMSAFVLPGLGQILNRQFVKGLILIAAITLIFLSLLVKVFLDLSVVMNEIIGADLTLGPDKWGLLMDGMRRRNLTMLWVLVAAAFMVWAFSIFDAYLIGRNYQPPAEEE